MFKYAIMAMAILFVFIGCSKKTESPLTYTIANVGDLTLRQTQDTTVIYAVGYTSGKQEAVTLQLDSLPTGITVAPATASGTGTFVANFAIHVATPAQGVYPVTLRSTTASGVKKEQRINITILPGFAYSVGGLSDVTVLQYKDTSINMPVSISVASGTPENVTIVPDSIPSGVTITPVSTSGLPPFSTTFAIRVKANTTGTFPLVFRTSSASTVTKTSRVNLVIGSNTNCAATIAGSYTASDACSPTPGSSSYTSNVTVTGASQIKIPIYFIGLTANLNCTNGTFTIEPKAYLDLTITGGSGTFNANQIVATYTVSGTVNTVCTTTLNR
ncbi:MAG: hypothetical protein V4649_00435 [Bacteroidota bacterium]